MPIGNPVNPKKVPSPRSAPSSAATPKTEEPPNDERDGPLTAHGEDDDEPVRKVDQDWDDSDEGDSGSDGEDDVEAPKSARAPASSAREGSGRSGSTAGSSTGDTGSRSQEGRDDDEEEAPQRSAPRQRMERRAPPNSIQELFGSEIPQRASYADAKLRQQLSGTVLVKVTSYPDRRAGPDRSERGASERGASDRRGSSEQRFLFDWTGDAAICAASEATTADCVISVSETNLMRIAQGDLNAQISMLSDKVRVDGQASLAIYFFNLVAPQTGSFV